LDLTAAAINMISRVNHLTALIVLCCLWCHVFRGFGGGRRAPPPPPSRVPAKVPQAAAAQPPASAVGAAQPRQPGLFGQMASTAVGVGIGSAVVCYAVLFLVYFHHLWQFIALYVGSYVSAVL